MLQQINHADIERAIGQPLQAGDKFTVLASDEGLDLIRIEREGAIIFQGKFRLQEGPPEIPVADWTPDPTWAASTHKPDHHPHPL